MRHKVLLDRSDINVDSLIIDGDEVAVDALLTADDVFYAMLEYDPDGEFVVDILEIDDNEEEADAD